MIAVTGADTANAFNELGAAAFGGKEKPPGEAPGGF